MIEEWIVVILMLIGLTMVIYWICNFSVMFIKFLIKASKKGENQRTIEELEKIKTKLDKIYQEENKNDSRWSAGVKYSCKIIGNHIDELKGE